MTHAIPTVSLQIVTIIERPQWILNTSEGGGGEISVAL
jgi:hypothetical protein